MAVSVEPGFPCAIDRVAAAADRCAHRFLRAAWYGADAPAGATTVVARRADGTVLAAIPTVPAGPSALGIRSVPGSYWPFRALPFLPDACPAEVARMLRDPAVRSALGAVWRLGPVYAEDPGRRLLVAAARAAGWRVLSRTVGTSFALDLGDAAAGGWPGRSTRKRLAGYERRLTQVAGPIAVRTVAGAGWSADALAMLGAIEARSWVGLRTDGSGAKFLTARHRAHWAAVLADPVLAAKLSATVLVAGEMPLAFSFDLRVGDRQYAIASSFHERYTRFRPGRIVTARQLAHAAAQGIRTVDLGAGDSGYKREMGAVPCARLVDQLFVRNPLVAAALGLRWRGGGAGDDALPPPAA